MKVTPEQIKALKGQGFLHNRGTDCFSGRIITVNGKINAEQMQCISEAAAKYGNGKVLFTARLTIEIPGIHFENAKNFQDYIAKTGLVTGGTGAKVRPVVSCKGTTCQYGLVDTLSLSEKIHKVFFEGYKNVTLPHKFKIAVGGCSNNCMKPDLNDIGIAGSMKPIYTSESCKGCKICSVEDACPMGSVKLEEGKMVIDATCINCGLCIGKCHFDCITEGEFGYKVYVGGRWGKSVRRADAFKHTLKTEEEVIGTIEKTILFYKDEEVPGKRFAETIDRLGIDYVEDKILSNDLMERKEEILAGKTKSATMKQEADPFKHGLC